MKHTSEICDHITWYVNNNPTDTECACHNA